MGQYVQEQDISSNSGGGAHAHTVRRWYKRLCEGRGAKVVRMWLEGGVAAAVRRWGCKKKAGARCKLGAGTNYLYTGKIIY
jgi:hypothetical protein